MFTHTKKLIAVYDRTEILRSCFKLSLAVLETQLALLGYLGCKNTGEAPALTLFKGVVEELDKENPDMALVSKLMDNVRKMVA